MKKTNLKLFTMILIISIGAYSCVDLLTVRNIIHNNAVETVGSIPFCPCVDGIKSEYLAYLYMCNAGRAENACKEIKYRECFIKCDKSKNINYGLLHVLYYKCGYYNELIEELDRYEKEVLEKESFWIEERKKILYILYESIVLLQNQGLQ